MVSQTWLIEHLWVTSDESIQLYCYAEEAFSVSSINFENTTRDVARGARCPREQAFQGSAVVVSCS